MSLIESLAAEMGHEAQSTRRLLDCIPEDKLGWKPHEKSMTLGGLGQHMAQLPQWTAMTMASEELNMEGMEPLPDPESKAAILEQWDNNLKASDEALASGSDEDLAVTWTLRMGDHVISSMPRSAVIRNWVLNHLFHHRGQLTVYLRLLDIPLPQVYGPTADDTHM